MIAARIIITIIATGLVVAALLFSIICVSTDSWVTSEPIVGVKRRSGLWKVCYKGSGDVEIDKCGTFDEDIVRKCESGPVMLHYLICS